MSVLDNPEIVDIVAKIGNLCLTDSFSDIVFVVDGERLPAHQVILAHRCPVFKAMFPPNSQMQKPVIELPETSLDAFKQLLKFIYAGTVELDAVKIGTVFDTMTVASTYDMPGLSKLCVDHLKSIHTVDDVVDMINEAVKSSHETLYEHGMNYFCLRFHEFFRHESFNKLPVKALYRALEEPTSQVSTDTIFRTFVGWMKANLSESEHFPGLLKQMDLTSMEINEIVGTLRPLNLVDANVLLDITCEHAEQKKSIIPHNSVTTSVATQYESSAKPMDDNSHDKDISNEYCTFYRSPREHTIEHQYGCGLYLTINLLNLTRINYLEFEILDGDWNYWVEFSKDNVNWTRVIDYSNYICRGVQELSFKKQVIRHIRICSKRPQHTQWGWCDFKMTRLFAYDNTQPSEFDPKTNIVIPSENVAEKRGVIIQGTNMGCAPNGMLNSDASAYNYTTHRIGADPIIVQLPQPYIVDSMRVWLNNSCSFNIQISTDKKTWTQVWSEEMVINRTHVKFEKQPVVFMKFTGTYSDYSSLFCRLLECPAVTNCGELSNCKICSKQ